MKNTPIIESHVNEEDFIITVIAPDYYYFTIYGQYDDKILVSGSCKLLTPSVFASFREQYPDVLDVSPAPGVTTEHMDTWYLKLNEGSNFFELDFSALNKEIDGTEHSHFRW